ncbi:hypothetical protein TGPRC2_264990 [Toxoplasma gondii TgCatPRC2]|uniref:Uncharacterized protein n=15 Tax=Toxoplasma gondii TaxID=5811 RepID=B9Q1J0_TOXGV|nr:hypothetical protein TGME49_264990 [Toxoplasma gondii ME49]EPR57334.1 hypothetical protein TGGT1_264990 [Toxoplasma gondii GT1]ESS33623.1 hypothetical protein TGVEG_264990 [Toxoplasma gondii VEG]KAF4644257.1 hypothetical protein TGRH88_012490 [Toxoplasma gondii]KFG32667.1 hypothetical protein TGP89_264990 [Toxoplasma gondii p89]KFG38497.1 hypothetical protein TGDOM2_264990 [Toxoplasma gondii GAB2-2007-GAL-DOM2]KFG42270.1 hypothetical protein TGFOU_264990 [Toxoplasma gondii FOU]KFG58269.1 |eukprot:XP_002368628.1 hypothetical protein TGME49_264990 [Toxoplasma gondii ME49]
MGNVIEQFHAERLDQRYGVLTTPDGKKRAMKPEDCRPRYYERTYREGDPEMPEDPEFPAKLLKAAQDHEWKIENGADGLSIMYPGKRQAKLWVGHVRVVNPEDRICPENGNANMSLDDLIHQGLLTPFYKTPSGAAVPERQEGNDKVPQSAAPSASRQQSEENKRLAEQHLRMSVNERMKFTNVQAQQQAMRTDIPQMAGSPRMPAPQPFPSMFSGAPSPYPMYPTAFPQPQMCAMPPSVNQPPPAVATGVYPPLLPIY